jgi:hypothetical protein
MIILVSWLRVIEVPWFPPPKLWRSIFWAWG